MKFQYIALFLLALTATSSACRVAFSAAVTRTQVLTRDQVVKYARVFINTGRGYDSRSGVFTCPRKGVYIFMLNGLARSGGSIALQLMHNHHGLVSAYGSGHVFNSGSNSVTLPLNKGDQIWIRSYGHGTSIVYGDPNYLHNSFSGYCIF